MLLPLMSRNPNGPQTSNYQSPTQLCCNLCILVSSRRSFAPGSLIAVRTRLIPRGKVNMYAVTVRMTSTSHKKNHPKCKLIPLSNSGGAVLDHEKKWIRNDLDVEYSPLNQFNLWRNVNRKPRSNS